jgi:hypothetical protein
MKSSSADPDLGFTVKKANGGCVWWEKYKKFEKDL